MTIPGAKAVSEPLTLDRLPNTVVLPATYPKSWVFIHDFHFNSIVDGRVAIVDVASSSNPLKGQLRAAQLANFLSSSARRELYVAETFYSRLTTGERSDVITIYDTATLEPKGEITMEAGKRGLFVTFANSFQFTNDERWALVFNFTPAASVTVVSLEERKVLSEIEIAGCSLIYPTGKRGFASLCADGTMTSIVLDTEGHLAQRSRSRAFNTIDTDPMFMMPATADGNALFTTFRGRVQPVELSSDVARELNDWSIVTERESNDGWAPSGWQVIAADRKGRLFVLMNPKSHDGSHEEGGTEVWIFDHVRHERLGRIALERRGVSIAMTNEPEPALVVAAADGTLDVYDVVQRSLVRSLGNSVVFNPQLIYATN